MNSPSSAPNPHDLFLEALELPAPVQRAAFLDGACRGDAVLRAAVEEMLTNHQSVSFPEDPAASMPTVITSLTEQAGEKIGRYKLLQEIGEGGFGSVWMAEQMEPVSRRVALKIIKLGMDTREVIARFEAERQALAMMDHPNIAKVLDAGATDKGRPFFVMELVKGVTITRFCDEQQLGTNERLALFSDVCAAINHAHQKGIIHRDIKPSNVMVTMHGDKAVVKVIDFGIAKATQGKLTDKTLFTRFEQFIGTPVYMSPEQAATSGLDIDTRSDIYALGILLYELLTGKPPFDANSLASAGYEEMRRIIREVEPPKPSSRLSTVAGEERTQLARARQIEPGKVRGMVEPDLDWIVMKAIEKDRSRRYDTANAFAQDIVRFLADEPVSATPPSAGYKFRKFTRRNKTALRVAAGIAAVLVAATIISAWQAIRATKAEKLANERLAQVAAERDAKDVARRNAENISTFLSEVFQSPDPTRDGRTIKVVDLLDKAAEKLERDLTSQPRRKADLRATLGTTYQSLGLARQAIPLQEKVRDFNRDAFGPEHPDTLWAMTYLATSYREAERVDEALQLEEQLLPLYRKVFGPEHPDTIGAMGNLAICLFRSGPGRQEEALKMKEEVLALSRKVNGPEHRDTFTAMSNLATSYITAGRLDEAFALSSESVRLCSKVLGPEDPDTLIARHNLAAGRSDAGHWDEAIKMQEELLPIFRKVLGPEHFQTLSAMNLLALSYRRAGRLDDALKLREETLALSLKVNGPEHHGTLKTMTELAVSYSFDADRNPESLKLGQESLPLYRKVLGPEHEDTLHAMDVLAGSYYEAGLQAESLKLREEMFATNLKLHGPEHPATLVAMTNLSVFLGVADQTAEAIALQEKSLTIMRRVMKPTDPHFKIALENMAALYETAGRNDEAAKLREELGEKAPSAALVKKEVKPLEQALETVSQAKGQEAPETIAAMTGLAAAYGADGSGRKAIKLGEEALALARRVLPAGDPRTVEAMKVLIRLYRLVDNETEAAKLEEEIKALPAKP